MLGKRSRNVLPTMLLIGLSALGCRLLPRVIDLLPPASTQVVVPGGLWAWVHLFDLDTTTSLGGIAASYDGTLYAAGFFDEGFSFGDTLLTRRGA